MNKEARDEMYRIIERAVDRERLRHSSEMKLLAKFRGVVDMIEVSDELANDR